VPGDSRTTAGNDAPHTSQCDKMVTWGSFLPESGVPARWSTRGFFLFNVEWITDILGIMLKIISMYRYTEEYFIR
jgi:hypothetical protein